MLLNFPTKLQNTEHIKRYRFGYSYNKLFLSSTFSGHSFASIPQETWKIKLDSKLLPRGRHRNCGFLSSNASIAETCCLAFKYNIWRQCWTLTISLKLREHCRKMILQPSQSWLILNNSFEKEIVDAPHKCPT